MQTKRSNLPRHGATSLLLDREEVDLFLDYLVETDPEPAKIHDQGENTEKKAVRDAEIRFIDQNQERLYRILNKIAVSANKYFKYDINGIEKAQIITYKAPSSGYQYHMDIGPEGTAANRKISMSLLLNDDFEGGEICFRYNENEMCKRPETGEAVIFSSFLSHKVKPITKGERFVVVAWFTGPPFR